MGVAMTASRCPMQLRKAPLSLCVAALFAAGYFGACDAAATNPGGIVIGSIADRTQNLSGKVRRLRPEGLLSVTSCEDDGGAGTLRAVIAGAPSGAVIDLTALTCSAITLLSGQIEVGVDDLSLQGPGAESLTIDGNQASNNQPIENGRVFLHTGAGALTIENLTIANGMVYSSGTALGGCLKTGRGAIVVQQVVVTGCRAITFGGGSSARGGAIYSGVNSAGVSVIDSVISGNKAIAKFNETYNLYGYTSAGGAIAARGPITVIDSHVVDNQAQAYLPLSHDARFQQAAGGAIAAYWTGDPEKKLVVTGSVISGNSVGCDTSQVQCYSGIGGAIRALGGARIESSLIDGNVAESMNSSQGAALEIEAYDAQIRLSTISDNHTYALPNQKNWGGGLEVVDANLDIYGSTINANSSYRGGGIWNSNSRITLSNTTISGNTVGDRGGGVFVSYPGNASLLVVNSTVTSNSSTGDAGGAGIVDASGIPGASTLQSSIIAGNLATAGPHTYDADLGVVAGAIEGANNLIVAASSVVLPPDTIAADPVLGPLAANGGATLTHALLAGSPAIDAGNNSANLDFDQRGPDFVRVAGASSDIGAFEVQPTSNDLVFANGFDNP